MFKQPGYILWQVTCRNSLVELWLGSHVASLLHAGHGVDLGGGSFKSLGPLAQRRVESGLASDCPQPLAKAPVAPVLWFLLALISWALQPRGFTDTSAVVVLVYEQSCLKRVGGRRVHEWQCISCDPALVETLR